MDVNVRPRTECLGPAVCSREPVCDERAGELFMEGYCTSCQNGLFERCIAVLICGKSLLISSLLLSPA